MKLMPTVLGCGALALAFSNLAWAGKPAGCETIQKGTLVAPNGDGSVVEVGYDQWGYNYQARKFNGYYCDARYDAAWCQEYRDDKLAMKWNDAWLDNKDCDGDGFLDRHYGFDGYIGSGAWLTNHMSGEYINDDGEACSWVYFIKIVAAPADAYRQTGIWYSADDELIGPAIWPEIVGTSRSSKKSRTTLVRANAVSCSEALWDPDSASSKRTLALSTVRNRRAATLCRRIGVGKCREGVPDLPGAVGRQPLAAG